jgi:predicted translin family RNA/ssDNA-binding protein
LKKGENMDENYFGGIKKYFENYGQIKDLLIAEIRKLTKLSKLAIFDVHKERFEEAKKKIDLCKSIAPKLYDIVKNAKNPRLGVYLEPFEQEYAEACLYYFFRTESKVVNHEIIGVSIENFIGGLADFTGELIRYSLTLANNKNIKELKVIKNLISDIYAQLIELNLTGELRKKFDSIKWNLNKIETIFYEVSLRINENN